MQARHGDLLIESVDAIPASAKKEAGRTLALGEATGHSHTLDIGQLRRDADGQLYFSSRRPMALTHQEHARIDLPAGAYKVTIQREYQPSAPPRQVVD